MICPNCQIESLVATKVNYPIGDSIIANVPVLRCKCGEIIVSEDDVNKMMKYINRPTHEIEVDWSELR